MIVWHQYVREYVVDTKLQNRLMVGDISQDRNVVKLVQFLLNGKDFGVLAVDTD